MAAEGRPRRRAGWGAAAGVEAAGFLRRMMCLIASVCFCAAENCWAKLSTASPKRPVCDTGAFRNCNFSCSFMSARHSQRWRSWTTGVDIARPRDCAVTFVARSARSVAARSSCRIVRSWPPSCRSFRALAWWRPGCRDERRIAAEAEGLRHVWHSGVYYATPRWSCPHKKNMNHPQKPPQRAECPDTWGSDRDRPEATETDHTQKRTGDKTSLKRRDHPCCSFREICSFSAEARRGAGHHTLLVWLSARTW